MSKAKAKKVWKRTPAQILLGKHLEELGLGPIEYEFRFDKTRLLRADAAIPSLRLLFECDGGQFHGGHMRGRALEQQYQKDRLAQLTGWRILRFTNLEVLRGDAKKELQSWLDGVKP